MKRWLQSRVDDYIDERLSEFIDLPESPEKEKELTAFFKEYPTAKNEYEKLQRLQTLLRHKKGVPPTVGFGTRLASTIEDLNKVQDGFLPIPRKFVPAFSIISALTVVFLVIFVYQNRFELQQYFGEKQEQIQQAYELGLLKGTLKPLLSGIDKDQVLNFALFGILPLDAKAETALRVNKDSSEGYRLELGRSPTRHPPLATASEFYKQVRPTQQQKQTLDSIFMEAKKEIESSVFVDEHQALAVDPTLVKFNEAMLLNMASVLTPPQRTRFERFLEQRNAPYTIASTQVPLKVSKSYRVPQIISRRKGDFLIITPETLQMTMLPVNLDSMRRTIETSVSIIQQQVNVHQRTLEVFLEKRDEWRNGFEYHIKPFRVQADSNCVSVHIESYYIGSDTEETIIQPRTARVRRYQMSNSPVPSLPISPERQTKRYRRTDSLWNEYKRFREDGIIIPEFDSIRKYEKYIHQFNQQSRRFDSLVHSMRAFKLRTDSLMKLLPPEEWLKQYKKFKERKIQEPEEI